MATCLNERRTNMFKNLTIVDVMCPVCRGIFIEPVMMPCHHALCLQCFERTMEEASLTCPMCRKRIGSWLRTATKDHNLVNSDLWAFIQKKFPDQVQAKLNGEEDGVEEHVVARSSTKLSSAGEIRREYELHIQKLEEETRKKLETERRASEDLIRKIQEEEERQYLAVRQQLLKQTIADEQLAKELHEQSAQSTSGLVLRKDVGGQRVGMDNKENKNRTHGIVTTQIKGPMDSYIFSQQKKLAASSGKCLTTSDSSFNVKFGNKLKTAPEMEKVRSASNMSSGSHDSINQEMHHFKPIKSVPRTPPKKLSDGRVLVPRVVKAVPVNLSPVYEALSGSGREDSFIGSSFRQQLMKVQMERFRNLRTSEMNPPISAFRGKASSWQKAEASKLGSGISEKEQISDEVESPRKKARKDINMDGRESNFTLGGLGSYSDDECKGKKVIAIVHNQADQFVEVEGKIGGHDRRFGGSEKEDNCDFSLVKKTVGRDDSDDELNYDDPNVSSVIGVEPESCAETPTDVRCLRKTSAVVGHETSSTGVNLKMNRLSINSTEKIPVNHCRTTHHTQRNNVVRRVHNNNNNDIKTAVSSNNCARPLGVSERRKVDVSGRCKDNLDEIVPFAEGDAAVLLSQEQARLEMLIRQEQADLELALRLQNEWDAADRRIDRSKGSLRAYELRNASKSQSAKKKMAAKKGGRGRQSTLEESFTGSLRSTRKR